MPNIQDIRLLLHAQTKGILDHSLVGACVSDLITAERAREPTSVVEVLTKRTDLTRADVEALFRELLDLEAGGERLVGSDTFMAMARGGGDALKWGETVGPYSILKLMTQNASGTLYEARLSEEGDDPVAIRILSNEAVQAPGVLETFQREARLAQTIEHPRFNRILDVGCEEGLHYVAARRAPGSHLGTWIRNGIVKPHDAAGVLAAIAQVCAFAHAFGFVHRDIRPSSIIVDDDGDVCLVNPSLGRDLLRQRCLGTETAKLLGAPGYLAPEQAVDDPEGVGTWTDVYAIGAVLFRIVTGRYLHARASFDQTLEAIRDEDAPDPCELRPNLPDALGRLIRRCTRRNRARRRTMGELAEALTELHRSGDLVGLPPPEADRAT